MSRSRLRRGARCSAFFLTLLTACGGSDDPSQTTPGESLEFVSAEGQAGQTSQATADAGSAAPASEASDSAGSSSRTVEEGDIYRSLSAGKLLNLNPYRGLQVIDIADVAKPRVIGRLRESGAPVEMYVIGQRAIVLLNNWTGYWGSRDDIQVEQRTGGLVLSVDLTDPTAPKIVDRELVPGSILTSRLTREGARSALYVAASEWECPKDGAGSSTVRSSDCSRTVVKSIDASTADLIPRTTLDLGGSVAALQATPSALIVARSSYTGVGAYRSTVSLVDIRSIDGQMVQGPEAQVAGAVQNKFNLDLRGDVLRVVSGTSWGNGQTANHVETFDTKTAALTRIADCAFGEGQRLFGTLFMEDRAFFVTYLRSDPFHAFSIDAKGQCAEQNEFVVSGWNDYFKPVFEDRRLIGVGTNDQNGRNVAVSLYDVTDLKNASPLLARKEVAAEWSYSAASYDDKAYSVIENAVRVPAGDAPDVIETGLVLLPYQSYGSKRDDARAGVQIYTFSERTLTARGFMNHGQPVQRTFQPSAEVTANLSSESLSLYDAKNPDAPVESGRVDLAPTYSDVHDYGTFLVRIHDTRGVYGGWWDAKAEPPPAYAEIIPKTTDPDTAEPLSQIVIPAGARTHRVGSLLVVISTRSDYSVAQPKHHSTITVHDLTNPEKPEQLASLESDRLLPAYGYGWGDFYGYGCGMRYGSYYDDFSRVLPNALVLGRNVPERESIGSHEICSRYVRNTSECAWNGAASCGWFQGYETCQRQIDGQQRTCEGSFSHCKRADGVTDCTPVTADQASAEGHCYTNELYRYWQSMELDVLDLRNPRAPTLSPVKFAREEEALGLVASGTSVYFAFKRPHKVAGDSRPFAKYYFREVALANPAAPAVGAPVNVPGQLLAVDGSRLVTRDLRWGSVRADTWLHALERVPQGARIVASQSFAERSVQSVLLDGSARVLVSHRPAWSASGYYGDAVDSLTILASDGLTKLGETEVDSWSELTQAVDGRVLFKVPSGLLIVNAQQPAAPYAQAYFPYSGYVRQVGYDGKSILLASGPYGLFRLDATTHNLLPR